MKGGLFRRGIRFQAAAPSCADGSCSDCREPVAWVHMQLSGNRPVFGLFKTSAPLVNAVKSLSNGVWGRCPRLSSNILARTNRQQRGGMHSAVSGRKQGYPEKPQVSTFGPPDSNNCVTGDTWSNVDTKEGPLPASIWPHVRGLNGKGTRGGVRGEGR